MPGGKKVLGGGFHIEAPHDVRVYASEHPPTVRGNIVAYGLAVRCEMRDCRSTGDGYGGLCNGPVSSGNDWRPEQPPTGARRRAGSIRRAIVCLFIKLVTFLLQMMIAMTMQRKEKRHEN